MRPVTPAARLAIALAFARIPLALALELTPDECYYAFEARHLDLAYHGHPPLLPWILALTRALFGDGAFAIRIVAIVCGLLVQIAIARIARRRGGEEAAIAAVLLAAFSPLGFTGGLVATPDAPAAAATAWMLVAIDAGEMRRAALLCAAATFAKLSALLGAVALGAFAILPIGAAGLAIGLGMLRGGEPIGAHVARALTGWEPPWRSLGEVLGGQLGVAGPVLAVAGIVALYKHRRDASRIAWIGAAPLAFVLLLALAGLRTEANWPALAWVAAIPLVATMANSLRVAAIASGSAILAIALAQALIGPLPLDAAHDPTAALTGWSELAREVARHVPAGKSLDADGYALAAALDQNLRMLGMARVIRQRGGRRSDFSIHASGPRSDFTIRPCDALCVCDATRGCRTLTVHRAATPLRSYALQSRSGADR